MHRTKGQDLTSKPLEASIPPPSLVNQARWKSKCVREKYERVKMVLGHDIGLEKVEALSKLTLEGNFMRNIVSRAFLVLWMDA